MIFTLDSSSIKSSRLIYILISTFLLAGLILSILNSPVHAAEGEPSDTEQNYQQESTCTPPNDWSQTVRVWGPAKPVKKWSFAVEEAEMAVELVFYYYQDYDKVGCPLDCSTGECQSDEAGKGESPLGGFSVIDGKEGANRGVKQLEGRLAQGTYQVVFRASGDPGSINVGLRVRQNALPTATPLPTNTPVPTGITPSSTPTKIPPTNTPPGTGTSPPPIDNPTPTKVKRTPPATLPPPTPFPGSPSPQVLIPQTGSRPATPSAGSGINYWLFVPLGVGLFGLGLAFYGIANRLKQQ